MTDTEAECIAEGHWTSVFDTETGMVEHLHDPDDGPCEFAKGTRRGPLRDTLNVVSYTTHEAHPASICVWGVFGGGGWCHNHKNMVFVEVEGLQAGIVLCGEHFSVENVEKSILETMFLFS